MNPEADATRPGSAPGEAGTGVATSDGAEAPRGAVAWQEGATRSHTVTTRAATIEAIVAIMSGRTDCGCAHDRADAPRLHALGEARDEHIAKLAAKLVKAEDRAGKLSEERDQARRSEVKLARLRAEVVSWATRGEVSVHVMLRTVGEPVPESPGEWADLQRRHRR